MIRPSGRVTAVLLAAGSGDRAGGDVPKQFLDLAGQPMLAHPLGALSASESIASIVVVLPEARPPFIEEELKLPKITSLAVGGATRQASLAEGLVCLPEDSSIVLVHDAARPLLTTGLIERVLDGLEESVDGAICAVPLDDALKEVTADGEVVGNLPRRGAWRAQTPQVFSRKSLDEALALADSEQRICDDCSEMLIRAGFRVRAVKGEPWNIKVTTKADLNLAEKILMSRTRAQ
jgi:2-C-methyl-D-erythritol 4-phosphate cytidylyltransferase